MSLETLDEKKLTPMIKHWYSVKKQYPEHLLAYRMGDFYEFFYSDAERISKLLGITLTKRKIGNESYPLAGIPYHANNYLKNLVNLGQTVVVVDQLEDPTTVKGRIVKRGVVRILTPGTVVESEMLNTNSNNFIAALIREKTGFGVAFSDISTGEFLTIELTYAENKDPVEKLLSVFSEYDPIELIIPADLKKDERLFLLISDLTNAIVKVYDDFAFNYSESYSLLTKQFKVSNLRGFGLEEAPLAIRAAGGLLYFLNETQRSLIPNIYSIQLLKQKETLHIDYITQRNLELIHSLRERGKESTLFSIFNHTHTPMGSRLLKKTILNPLTNIEKICNRLDIVEDLKNNVILRSDLRDVLKEFGDLIRFINRLNYLDRSNARDLVNIRNSLEKIPKIKDLLKNLLDGSSYLSIEKINSFQNIRTLIYNSILENPSSNLKDGNLIRDEYNKNVDELRDLIKNGKRYILEYETAQRNKLNINSGLKIGFNNILGYYIQITKNTLKSLPRLPEEYIERQTLKNAKRFTSSELKELENKIVKAEEEINELEYGLFCEIRDQVIVHTQEIIKTANTIAEIDVLACFAEISELYNYSRPEVNNTSAIAIRSGRHPVVEQLQITEKFVPNDCDLDTETEQIRIITGPNMAGKSTYLRQVALICLIAQMGCFVPANSAKIGVLDQIFTRIGASDDLARNLSTFMIEASEVAKILNYATPKSLVIVDELGRGTSTSDGLSIAMATLEKLHALKCKTLFSTHFHQITENDLPRVKNYHLNIIENQDGSIYFVRKLEPGVTDKSYGIHVAKLAGIPEDVIKRAFEILEEINDRDPFNEKLKSQGILERKISRNKPTLNQKSNDLPIKTVQTSLFKPIVITENKLSREAQLIIDELNHIDIESITPIDAMRILIDLKEKLSKNDS